MAYVAAVTAIVLLGKSHPNDISLNPEFIVQLWEGDSANWTANSLTASNDVERVGPVPVDNILQAGCKLVKAVMERTSLDSAAFAILERSSIERDVTMIGELLPGINLHVLTSAGSRVYSQWRDGATVKGCVKS